MIGRKYGCNFSVNRELFLLGEATAKLLSSLLIVVVISVYSLIFEECTLIQTGMVTNEKWWWVTSSKKELEVL